jgi:uncharacterized membrane protein YraQ (UPF0718 family)
MAYLYIITGAGLLISLAASRQKTVRALRLAVRRLLNILPPFVTMMIIFSVTIVLLPEEVIAGLIGQQSGWRGVMIAAALGSIVFVPGFIAFPLSGALLQQGVPYAVLAAFTTTLMMVGIVTYPMEREYFGHTVTVIRNIICLLVALITAAVVGWALGGLPA